jgi:hypothetical protein
MIICPNCHHKEIDETIFCSRCGAQLISAKKTTTKSIGKPPSGNLSDADSGMNLPLQGLDNQNLRIKTSIYLLESGQTIDLEGNTEFTIGRKSIGQTILPDIDLSHYDAYNLGVSRLHITIKTINDRLVVVDLGSANGTRVNGQKLTPHVEYPLSHGDILALGKLKFQLILIK